MKDGIEFPTENSVFIKKRHLKVSHPFSAFNMVCYYFISSILVFAFL